MSDNLLAFAIMVAVAVMFIGSELIDMRNANVREREKTRRAEAALKAGLSPERARAFAEGPVGADVDD